jgi:hypothetical protein
MSQSLADLLPGSPGGGRIRVWLKSSAYTKRLLLGEAGDPWGGAAQYLAYFSQAHGLLRPDVAVVEAGELYDSWLARHPEHQRELGAKRRLSYPLRKWLEPTEPREVLAEVLEAVAAHLRGQVPLVLAMPSPRAWLQRASVLAGREGVELDPDAIEDAAMYVADVLRSVSQLPVAGLLFEEEGDGASAGPLEVERYRPRCSTSPGTTAGPSRCGSVRRRCWSCRPSRTSRRSSAARRRPRGRAARRGWMSANA